VWMWARQAVMGHGALTPPPPALSYVALIALKRKFRFREPGELRLASQPWPGPDFCAKWGRGPEPWPRAQSPLTFPCCAQPPPASAQPASGCAGVRGRCVRPGCMRVTAAARAMRLGRRAGVDGGRSADRHGQLLMCRWLRRVQHACFAELGACVPEAACFGGQRDMALAELGGHWHADRPTRAPARSRQLRAGTSSCWRPWWAVCASRRPPSRPPAYLQGVAYGCPLLVLQQYCARWGT
jgi:hypothetical protein